MTSTPTIRDLERRLAASPASPLFARLALGRLAQGEISVAEELCERGLKLFPGYATGLLARSRCLAARGRHAEAVDVLREVSKSYPGNILLMDLEDEWRGSISAEAPPVTETGMMGEAEVILEAPTATPGAVTPAHRGEMFHDTPETVPSPLATGPDGTIPILQPVPPSHGRTSFIEGDRIVSRTLAEIYAAQGAIGEAVETYRLLIDRLPGEGERLSSRLRELEDRLGSAVGGAPPAGPESME